MPRHRRTVAGADGVEIGAGKHIASAIGVDGGNRLSGTVVAAVTVKEIGAGATIGNGKAADLTLQLRQSSV